MNKILYITLLINAICYITCYKIIDVPQSDLNFELKQINSDVEFEVLEVSEDCKGKGRSGGFFYWPPKTVLKLRAVPHYIISCIDVHGKYKIHGGAIGTPYLELFCDDNAGCDVDVYAEKINEESVGVTGFELIYGEFDGNCKEAEFGSEQRKLPFNYTLHIKPDEDISCIDIKGKHLQTKPGINFEGLSVKCLEEPSCNVRVHLTKNNQQVNSVRSSFGKITKCDGNKGGSWNWAYDSRLTLQAPPHVTISCIDVEGKYEIHGGAVGTRHLEVDCLEPTGCHIDVYVTLQNGQLVTTDDLIKLIGFSTGNCKEEEYMFTWPLLEKNISIYIPSGTNIKCMNIKGSFSIKATINKNSLELVCTDPECTVKLYGEKIESNVNRGRCEGKGKRIKSQSWKYNETLRIKTYEVISCIDVRGKYEITDGKVGTRNIAVKCLETRGCHIEVYVHHKPGIENGLVYSIINEDRDKCEGKGSPAGSKDWPFNTILAIQARPPYVISCIDVKGKYSITGGKIGTSELDVKCLQGKGCHIEVYVTAGDFETTPINVKDNCEGKGVPADSEDWAYNSVLFLHAPPHIIISCIEVKGKYSIIDGKIGTSELGVKCLEKAGCHIEVYVTVGKDLETLPEITKDIKENCKGKGTPAGSKDWPLNGILTINTPPPIIISCIEVKGKYSITGGKTGTSHLEVKCLEGTGCHIEVYVTIGKDLETLPETPIVDNIKNNCEGKGIPAKTADWPYKSVLTIDAPVSIEISCIDVTGKYSIVGGAIGSRHLEVQCLEPKGCHVVIYAQKINKSKETMESSLILTLKENCEGKGIPAGSKDWSFEQTLIVNAPKFVIITCIDVKGKFSITKGAIGTSHIEVKCLEKSGCHIEVYAEVKNKDDINTIQIVT